MPIDNYLKLREMYFDFPGLHGLIRKYLTKIQNWDPVELYLNKSFYLQHDLHASYSAKASELQGYCFLPLLRVSGDTYIRKIGTNGFLIRDAKPNSVSRKTSRQLDPFIPANLTLPYSQ